MADDAPHKIVVFAPPPASSEITKPTYSLLTLTPALLALLNSPSTASSLEIRGHKGDAAVLCTPTQTFSLRGVQNSNSLLLCSGGVGERFGEDGGEVGDVRMRERVEGTIEISTTLHETLEVVPTVARTDRLAELLKGSEYEGEDAEASSSSSNMLTFDALRSLLPASDREIKSALWTHRVVTLNDFLRPIPPPFLLKILPPLLRSLTPPAARPEPPAAPMKGKGKGKATAVEPSKEMKLFVDGELDELLAALDSVDCEEAVGRLVLEWYADPKDDSLPGGLWALRIPEIVREIGIGLLASGGYAAQHLQKFLSTWAELCAPFGSFCTVGLLSGQVIATASEISFFPISRLSPDPSTRFNELFAVKPRWKEEDMVVFVDDLVGGEKKKREAMVLKYVRKVKEGGTTTWAARNLW